MSHGVPVELHPMHQYSVDTLHIQVKSVIGGVRIVTCSIILENKAADQLGQCLLKIK